MYVAVVIGGGMLLPMMVRVEDPLVPLRHVRGC